MVAHMLPFALTSRQQWICLLSERIGPHTTLESSSLKIADHLLRSALEVLVNSCFSGFFVLFQGTV